MADEKPETDEQAAARVKKAKEDQAKRDKKSPSTGVLTYHDVIRHLVLNGPARDDAERAELLGVVDEDDPDVKTDVKTDEPDRDVQPGQPGYVPPEGGK